MNDALGPILVVEDVSNILELLEITLRFKGYRVMTARDGKEALDRVAEERPTLIITDILMPTMDGYEFVRQLRSDPAIAATPVIFYTAHYLEREARDLAAQCGVRHILTKPAEPDQRR